MKTIIRRFLAVFLSVFLVFSSTQNAFAAGSKWTVDTVKSSGARVVLGASSNGYKSAINIPPNVLKIAKYGLKGANLASLAIIAAGLVNDGIDFVMNPENNGVDYKRVYPPGKYMLLANLNGGYRKYNLYSSVAGANDTEKVLNSCKELLVALGVAHRGAARMEGLYCFAGEHLAGSITTANLHSSNNKIDSTISAADMAVATVSAASSNNFSLRSAAQQVLRNVATAAVIAGDYDADLLAGAVPTTETKPLIPAIPGAQAGDSTTGMGGGDVGAVADAAREAADKAANAAGAAKDVATAAAEEARRLNDEAKDLISSSVDKAIKDAANAAAAGAAADAVEAQKVANAAALEAAKAAAEAVRAADAKTAEAVRAADKAAADRDAAVAAGASAEAIAVADAKTAAAVAAKDAAVVAAAAAKERAEAAEKAAEKAKAEAAKPFELPDFCTWAKPVCDVADWLQKPAPDIGEDSELDIDDPDVVPADTDINFGGSCPADFAYSGSIFGNPINITLLDTGMLCDFLSTYVKYPVYAASSLFALYILGGRKDG